ncbi:MAG: pyridoxal-5'-phosphate-dependent protein subunit beta [Acidilobaceae archaeon]
MYECPRCGYRGGEEVCPKCGSVTTVFLERLTFRAERGERGVWRFSGMLPSLPTRHSLGEGSTPLTSVDSVRVKNERFNPTGSYADRASALLSSYVLSKGWRKVASLYEPDFSRSLVRYLEGLEVDVITPDPLSLEAEDIAVLTTRARLVRSSEAPRADYASPWSIEGLKTVALEICEQRARESFIVAPSKSGLLALSLLKGLRDLERAGADCPYEVVAAGLKGREPPLLAGLPVRTESIGEEEVYETLARLSSRGFRVKPLAAIGYAVASSLGDSIAVVTVAVRPPLRQGRSAVKRLILSTLEGGRKTAYEIWKERPAFTLRAVYKAARDMEERSEICYDVVRKGGREVKLYRLC